MKSEKKVSKGDREGKNRELHNDKGASSGKKKKENECDFKNRAPQTVYEVNWQKSMRNIKDSEVN